MSRPGDPLMDVPAEALPAPAAIAPRSELGRIEGALQGGRMAVIVPLFLLLGLGQFTAPLILGRASGVDVLTTEMFKLVQSYPVNFGLGAGLGSPLIVAGIAIVVLQRVIIGDQTRFVVARGRSEGFSAEPRWWAVPVVLLYGLFAGSAFTPLPAQARVQAIGLTLDGHPGVAIAAKNGKAVLKAQRTTPDPLLLPTSTASVSAVAARPLDLAPDLPDCFHAQTAASPYRARAPPAA